MEKWTFKPATERFDASVVSEKGKVICYAAKNSAEDTANIKLCAAAPELMDALLDILEEIKPLHATSNFYDRVYAKSESAIKKAIR